LGRLLLGEVLPDIIIMLDQTSQNLNVFPNIDLNGNNKIIEAESFSRLVQLNPATARST
jgi:hypothetical protein